jgi:hypothetical protein
LAFVSIERLFARVLRVRSLHPFCRNRGLTAAVFALLETRSIHVHRLQGDAGPA